ncbi:MAG: fimbrillin family protein [Candidatus Cryptobacteroides sp.]
MNKSILSMGLICAAAFTLTNCTKELESQAPVEEGVPFEITASTGSTKTTNNYLKTVWATNDPLSVFHAEAGSSDYGTNDEFKCTSTSENSFSGTLSKALEDGKSYDWYAIYKGNSGIKTPASVDADGGFIYIGNRNGVKQDGLNSTKHLSGTSCNMYGVAKNIAADQPVAVDMKHLTSVVKINVENTSGADLTISSVEFTAEEDIVGSYYIDFTSGSPKYVASASYVSNTAKLTATNATIPNGETAAFYIPIKPFTAASGKKLTISVNGKSKEKTLTKDVTFVAGTIHALNFDFNYPVILPSSTSVDVAKEGGDKSFTYTITNPIAGKSLSAATSDTWIKDIDYSTAGKVSFNVEANEGIARSGKITLSYDTAEDVKIAVNQEGTGTAKVYLSEDFTSLTAWSTSTAESFPLTSGTWTASGNVYGQNGCIKIGKSSTAANSITTPALSSISGTADVVLTFKAVSSYAGYTMSVVANNAGTVGELSPSSITKNATAINGGSSTATALSEAFAAPTATFTVTITGATSATTLTIKTSGDSKAWYLDDVKVVSAN